MLLALLRAVGIAPCPEAASVGAAALAPAESEPEANTDADIEDDTNLVIYTMEIREHHVVPLGHAHPVIDIYSRSRMHDHPVIAADTPEVPMQWTESAMYCSTCQFWLNGQQQWEEHLIGKKHRKNVRRERDFIRIDNPQQRRQKLRIPWLASSKATLDPLTVWLVEQEGEMRNLLRRRKQEYVRRMLRTVVQAWKMIWHLRRPSDAIEVD